MHSSRSMYRTYLWKDFKRSMCDRYKTCIHSYLYIRKYLSKIYAGRIRYYEVNAMESIIIGIAGGSGSGKSTFTNRVKKYFGDDITVIYHDNYYHRQDGIPYEKRVTVNYDHPDSLETDLLVKHLKQLKAGKTTGKISNAKAVDTAGKAAAKSAVKGSIVNKIAAIAVAVGVIGGSAYGIVAWNNQRNQTAQMATATTESSNSTKNTSTSENKTSSATTEATTEQPKQKIKLSEVYKKVLTDVENGKYEFPDSQGNTDYYYFVRDMNKDGVKELIVAPKWSVNEYTNYDIRVFSCINSEEGYKLSVISGHKWISNLSTNGGVCIPSDGNGLLIHNFTKGTGQSDVHRMTIQNGKLVYGDTEQTFSMGDSEWDSFAQENPEATWTAISDKSKIEELQ